MTKTERKQFISELANLGRHLRKENADMDNTTIKETVTTYSEYSKNGYSIKYQVVDSEVDTEKEEDSPVYVYDGSSIFGLTFKEFSTIADAVRFAIKASDSKILFNGNVIKYNICDDDTAYYIDSRTNKMMIVNI